MMIKSLSLIKNVLIISAVLLLNSIGHTSAVSAMTSHQTYGMNHGSSESGSCATLCRSAVVNRDIFTILNQDEEDDDDKRPNTFYSLSQSAYSSKKLVSQLQFANEVKPPPKVPAYILHSVFRV